MDTIRDYGQDQESAKQFLREFSHINDDGEPEPKYSNRLTQLANGEAILINVELNDLEQFNNDLAKQVYQDTVRYTKIFLAAVDELLPSYKTRESDKNDPMDVFIEQRKFVAERNQRNQQGSSASVTTPSSQVDANGRANIEGQYPAELIRKVEVYFKPASLQCIAIREVKAEYVGKLITIRGIVTRVTDVKPKIVVACYTCDQCGCESFQLIPGTDYTPLSQCSSSICTANKTLGRISPQIRGSKFIKFQEIKLQEHTDQVPTGHIPKTITLQVYGEQTRQCSAGDHISVSGVFLPADKRGFRMRSGGLAVDTYIEAHYITQMNKTEDDELNVEPMSTEEASQLVIGGNLLHRLSSSIAPEIFGHEQLKKALLLLLVGGVDKLSDTMKIRGNINICLMGDPGVAKSQMLSFIDRLASRSQYTTGRGSSGVGLTAAVLKDPITNELILEGGALVLADQGICCIDEFDKMMDADRTAIHEVMEQQTVSIAKAGIMTTLNARVSILAAANPAYGRYNIHRSITENLQLPPALLSRFDLLWLIKDTPNTERDLELAQHVTNIHTHPEAQGTTTNGDAIDMKVMRRYINLCKTKNPYVPESLDKKLVKIYCDIRNQKRCQDKLSKDNKDKDKGMFTSPRCLLAIIRLSTAFARLRLADFVEEADVKAAVDLYNSSRESIEAIEAERREAPTSKLVSDIMRQMSRETGCKKLTIPDILIAAQEVGIDEEATMIALKKLQHLDFIDIFGDDEVMILG